MTFIEKVKNNIKNKKLPSRFTIYDLKKCKDISENDIKNISNYDIKNSGSKNKNNKVLESKTIDGLLYYFCTTEITNII